MKKILIVLFVLGNVMAMMPPDIPKLNDLENINHRLDDTELFDIRPIYNEHISRFGPEGKEFVNNITELKLKECKNLAESHFQRRDTEEAKKCMELLAVTAGWSRFMGNENLMEQIIALYSEEVTRKSIQYYEFIGDVMYMGLYKTLRKEDGTTVYADEIESDMAEFFKEMASYMYRRVEWSLDDRKGLNKCFVYYSTRPEYYPDDVWPNWHALQLDEDSETCPLGLW
ncbi:MAG: hypothetical protein LBP41_02345 [Holosporaceae bacterium]|nr:hypothetical protein [Holosporaceae bacterium]